MSKALNSLDDSKSQLLDMCIMHFSVKEIPTKVVDHMFVAFIMSWTKTIAMVLGYAAR